MLRSSSTRRAVPQSGNGPMTVPRTVPFDYAAEFPINGSPGQSHESVINISPDGAFTAVAISYGFDEERGRAIDTFNVPGPTDPGSLKLSQFPVEALLDGVRVNPKFLPVVFEVRSTQSGVIPIRYSTVTLSNDQLNTTPIFQRIAPPAPIDFFLSVTDSATGRELQAQPSFSIATLGESTGRRPFRALPVPVRLDARASLRLQVIERTPNITGTLFINLIGYHDFIGGCASPSANPPAAGARLIPFDYVTRLQLTGETDRRVEDEIVVDGNFAATSISYGLQTDSSDIPIDTSSTSLPDIPLKQLPIRTLVDGFRVRPEMIRFAFPTGDALNPSVDSGLASRLFETLNQPEAVSFRYSLFDSGVGRDLQNQTIHNIAGLGSALGERPFKRLAKPLRLDQSSTFRVRVVERFGRGELFVVLQGYRAVAGGIR